MEWYFQRAPQAWSTRQLFNQTDVKTIGPDKVSPTILRPCKRICDSLLVPAALRRVYTAGCHVFTVSVICSTQNAFIAILAASSRWCADVKSRSNVYATRLPSRLTITRAQKRFNRLIHEPRNSNAYRIRECSCRDV